MSKANNLFPSATPEQKLRILSSEMATPIEIIRGCIAILKRHHESISDDQEDLRKCINAIEEAATYLQGLREELL